MAMRWLVEGACQGERVAYLAPTYAMAAQASREMLEGLHVYVTESQRGRRIGLYNGGYIDVWSLEQGGDRIRGQKYHRVVIDEAALVPGLRRVWERVVRPTLADYRGRAWILSTPRRGGDFESLYQDAERDSRRGDSAEWAAWTLRTSDNPHIPGDEIEAARSTLSEDAYATEYLASFAASATDLVYPRWSVDKHVGRPTVDWAECTMRVVGIDPGGGDPTAMVLVGVGKDEVVNVFAPEFYRRGDVHPDMMVEWLARADGVRRIQRVAVGETGGNILTNHLRRVGYPAIKASMRRGEGIEWVTWLLAHDRLRVDPRCVELIAEFSLYRWAQRRDVYEGDRYATAIPGDRHGDALDALRYAVGAVIGSLRGGREVVAMQRKRRGVEV